MRCRGRETRINRMPANELANADTDKFKGED